MLPVREYRLSTLSRNQRGFTLLELLLALAILSALSAVIIPQISWVLGDRRIAGAASQLRADLTRLRVDAMRDGRVWMLEAMVEGNQLRAKPFFSMSDATEAIDQTGSQSSLLQGADQATPAVLNVEGEQAEELFELPPDVTVESVNVVSAARAIQIEQATEGERALGWSRPILFYPDGVTSTAIVILKHEEHGRMAIKIRGITGDVTIGPAGAEQ